MMEIIMKNRTLLLIGLTITLLACGIPLRKAQAQTTILKIEAPAEVPTGQDFTASIIAQDVTGLYGWDLIVIWTPGTINCTSETANFAVWTAFLGPWVDPPIDNVLGTYHQSLTGRIPALAVSGTFWLTNLTFQVIKGPCNTTDLTLQAPGGYTYCLLDYDANEITHQFVKASVHVIPEFATLLMLPLLMIFSTSSLVIAKKMRKRR
jgi:hypothetical protein